MTLGIIVASNGQPCHDGFHLDDYDEINKTYFHDILRSRSWSALLFVRQGLPTPFILITLTTLITKGFR